MTLAEAHVKWSGILMDLSDPDIFSILWMKGQVLHREWAHLKVPVRLVLVWNELLTKKLYLFLSRLNEVSGGCENIVPVSESFWSNLKFFRMIDLTARLWGWNERVNGMRLVFSFSAVRGTDCRSIRVGHGGGPLEWQKQDSHVHRKTGTSTGSNYLSGVNLSLLKTSPDLLKV